MVTQQKDLVVRKTTCIFNNINTTYFVYFGCDFSVLFVSVFVFTWLLIPFSISAIDPFFPQLLFNCLCLLSLIPLCPCLFLHTFSAFHVPVSFSVLSGLPPFFQQRSQFDLVSLVIQGSLEGELNLMDNLSGSICHYYSLPPRSSKHNTDKKVNNRQNDDSLPPFYA